MHRFYCHARNITPDKITITEPQTINHIKNVLRFKINDKITIFDGSGYQYEGRINLISKEKIEVSITNRYESKQKPLIYLSAAVALPKGNLMDYVIEKLTELGIDTIIPMVTQRTVVKLDEERKAKKAVRWRKIAQYASEQAQRMRIPEVEDIQTFEAVIKGLSGYGLCFIATLFGKRTRLKSALKNKKPRSVIVFIGPEGDFTPQEVSGACSAGCIPIDLGQTVLKVDTAAIAAVSALNYALR